MLPTKQNEPTLFIKVSKMVSKAKIKYLKSLQVKKYRKQEQSFVVEGEKGVEELLASDFTTTLVCGTRDFLDNHIKSIGKNIELIEATPAELRAIGSVETNDSALAVLSDIRTGLPGGADERDGGDAAAAFLLAPGDADTPVLAEPVAAASITAEFLERWRVPGDAASRQWEERFGEHAYVPLAEAAVANALKQAGITGSELAAVIVAGPHGRANKRAAARAIPDPEVADSLRKWSAESGIPQRRISPEEIVDRCVLAERVMMGDPQPLRSGKSCNRQRVFNRAVAPPDPLRVLAGEVLRIVEHQVGASEERGMAAVFPGNVAFPARKAARRSPITPFCQTSVSRLAS